MERPPEDPPRRRFGDPIPPDLIREIIDRSQRRLAPILPGDLPELDLGE